MPARPELPEVGDPGLLETAEYARQLFVGLATPGADVGAQTAKRLERQQILYGDGRQFRFLIAEPALLWSPAPGLMPAQPDRLLSVSTLAVVELRILPTPGVGAFPRHSFVYHVPEDDEADPFVTGELLHTEFSVRQENDVQRYHDLWDALWDESASGTKATEIIRAATLMS